jgi:PIN domain nuclease of toxin-antitoxin system
MRALLDTHTLLWATTEPWRLSPAARSIVASEANEVFVSAASAWEISTKVRRGKMPWAEDLEREFVSVLTAAGYSYLAVDVEQALRAGRLVGAHKDPFDRMIAAQALALDIPVVSNDEQLDGFGVRRVW